MTKGVFLFTRAERDVRILEGMAGGLNNLQIAKAMGLSHGTVRIYVSELIAKLGAKDRTHAVMRGIADGLIKAPAATPAAPVGRRLRSPGPRQVPLFHRGKGK